jgi:hypothetical protein
MYNLTISTTVSAGEYRALSGLVFPGFVLAHADFDPSAPLSRQNEREIAHR